MAGCGEAADRRAQQLLCPRRLWGGPLFLSGAGATGRGCLCPAVLGTRTQNQGLGRSQPPRDCGADHSSPVPLSWERGPLCPVQDFWLSRGWGPPWPHLGFLGVQTALAPSRFLRGHGPPRPHLGFSGARTALAPSGSLGGAERSGPIWLSRGRGPPWPRLAPSRFLRGANRSGPSGFLGSRVCLHHHIPPLVSRLQRTHTTARQVCSGAQVAASTSGPDPATSVKTLLLTRWYPGAEATSGTRLRLPTGAKPMGRPCFLPDAPGGRGSRNQPSCPEPPCHSHSRRQPPCH